MLRLHERHQPDWRMPPPGARAARAGSSRWRRASDRRGGSACRARSARQRSPAGSSRHRRECPRPPARGPARADRRCARWLPGAAHRPCQPAAAPRRRWGCRAAHRDSGHRQRLRSPPAARVDKAIVNALARAFRARCSNSGMRRRRGITAIVDLLRAGFVDHWEFSSPRRRGARSKLPWQTRGRRPRGSARFPRPRDG